MFHHAPKLKKMHPNDTKLFEQIMFALLLDIELHDQNSNTMPNFLLTHEWTIDGVSTPTITMATIFNSDCPSDFKDSLFIRRINLCLNDDDNNKNNNNNKIEICHGLNYKLHWMVYGPIFWLLTYWKFLQKKNKQQSSYISWLPIEVWVTIGEMLQEYKSPYCQKVLTVFSPPPLCQKPSRIKKGDPQEKSKNKYPVSYPKHIETKMITTFFGKPPKNKPITSPSPPQKKSKGTVHKCCSPHFLPTLRKTYTETNKIYFTKDKLIMYKNKNGNFDSTWPLLELLLALLKLDINNNDSNYLWSITGFPPGTLNSETIGNNPLQALQQMINFSAPKKKPHSTITLILEQLTFGGPHSLCQQSTIIYLLVFEIQNNTPYLKKISLRLNEFLQSSNILKKLSALTLASTNNWDKLWYHFTPKPPCQGQELYQQLLHQLWWEKNKLIIYFLWCWKNSPDDAPIKIPLSVFHNCLKPFLLPPNQQFLSQLLQLNTKYFPLEATTDSASKPPLLKSYLNFTCFNLFKKKSSKTKENDPKNSSQTKTLQLKQQHP